MHTRLRGSKSLFTLYQIINKTGFPFLMPLLNLLYHELRCPYDVQIPVSVRPPQGDLAIIVRVYGLRGLYDFV